MSASLHNFQQAFTWIKFIVNKLFHVQINFWTTVNEMSWMNTYNFTVKSNQSSWNSIMIHELVNKLLIHCLLLPTVKYSPKLCSTLYLTLHFFLYYSYIIIVFCFFVWLFWVFFCNVTSTWLITTRLIYKPY